MSRTANAATARTYRVHVEIRGEGGRLTTASLAVPAATPAGGISKAMACLTKSERRRVRLASVTEVLTA